MLTLLHAGLPPHAITPVDRILVLIDDWLKIEMHNPHGGKVPYFRPIQCHRAAQRSTRIPGRLACSTRQKPGSGERVLHRG